MQREFKALIFLILIAAVVVFGIGDTAYALNGTRTLGFSARDSAMAGATTASSTDTSCLVRNPAGLARVDNKIDVLFMNIMPHDMTMATDGPTSVLGPGVPFVNRGLKQTSDANYLPAGDIAISYRLPGTDKYPVTVGIGAFTMAGLAVNYQSSRLNTAVTGDYDKMVQLESMRIAPGVAVSLTDKLSVGVTGNFAIQALRTNMATPSFAETAGGGDWDFAPGGGFTVGLQYQFNDMLGLGASYESHTWMGHHYKYKDCLPYIDEPQLVNLGFSLKPVKNLEFTFDTRYINWTDGKISRNTPGKGGFGWNDQWVFATGGEYTYKDKLKLRLGYNYGQSQIQPSVVFANAYLPLIFEHHLTTGFSYQLTKSLSLDFTWEHHFFNAMADNGAGDMYSQYGAGTKITAAAEVISVGVGYKF